MPAPSQRSEHPAEPGKGPLESLVDLAVFAPLGLLMNLDEIVPQLVEKGHQQVKVARFFGRMAVRTGSEAARRRVSDVRRPPTGGHRRGAEEAPVVALRSVPAPQEAPGPLGAATPEQAPAAPAEPAPDPATLAIPDYDVLSASQVVPRLPGLNPDELDAVRRYETANRGRKTILAKIAQLQA